MKEQSTNNGLSKNIFINASCGFSVWILVTSCYFFRIPSSSNADHTKLLAMLVITVSPNSENLKVNLNGMETAIAIA